MRKAFVLGAGHGMRLRPLTSELPKPLVPLLDRPLITYAFDDLIGLGVGEAIVNTHHRPGEYARLFPDGRYRDLTLTFRHEPDLLDTGGGIANIADLVDEGDGLVVYNGDILTTLPLQRAMELHEAHEADGALATLVLRPHGPALQVAIDQASSRVIDINNLLETDAPRAFQFTGIYFLSPGFFHHLYGRTKHSVIPVFLDLVRDGHKLAGAVVEGGSWFDLGTRDAYLEAHRFLAPGGHVAPGARIDPSAAIVGATCVGEGAAIGSGAHVSDCVLWPGAEVAPDAHLARCVVRTGARAEGFAQDRDF